MWLPGILGTEVELTRTDVYVCQARLRSQTIFPLSLILTVVNLIPGQGLEKTVSEPCKLGAGTETQFLSLCHRIWISQTLGQ